MTALDPKGVLVTCHKCGKRNRLAYERLGAQGRCGQCQASLQLPAEPLEVPGMEEFLSATTRSTLPVLVDFWAPWCGPCLQMAPELAKIAAQVQAPGKWLVLKVNTEIHQGIGARHRITALPTLAVFHQGQEISREQGARPASAILQLLAATKL